MLVVVVVLPCCAIIATIASCSCYCSAIAAIAPFPSPSVALRSLQAYSLSRGEPKEAMWPPASGSQVQWEKPGPQDELDDEFEGLMINGKVAASMSM